MKVLIIADTDLDGTGAATIITKYHELFNTRSKFPPFRIKQRDTVNVYFPERNELNKKFEDEKWVQDTYNNYDLIYLCDTGLKSDKGNRNLGEILASSVIYFDHHSTNLENQSEYKDNYHGFYIEEGDRCTAKIAYDVLLEILQGGADSEKVRKFKKLQKFSLLINDLDLWYRRMIRSTELADYESVVGPRRGFESFMKICENPDANVDDMSEVLSKVAEEKSKSLALAKSTLVKHKEYKTPFHTCFVDNWASWVSGEICPKTGMLVMLDLGRNSLSFRVGSKYVGKEWHGAKEPKPDCLDFAEHWGGGGHPQAAGVSGPEVATIFKMLSGYLGEILLEDYNDRPRR